MRAIKIDVVSKTITEIKIKKGLRALYLALDCQTVEVIGIDDGEDIWVDEEGLLHDEPIGAFTLNGWNHPVSGHGIILGTNSEGESVSTKLKLKDVIDVVRFVSVDDLPEPSFTFIPLP